MTEYEPRGYLKLTRRADAKLSEESEDYANIYIVSSHWGYKLVRRTIQEDSMEELMLRSLGLTYTEWEPGDPDEADLVFTLPTVTLEDINHLEKAIPEFFEAIRSRGIDGQFDFNFIPDDGQSDTISLVCYPNSQVAYRLELSYADDMADPVYEDPNAGDDFDGLGIAPATSETQPEQATEHGDNGDEDWARI